MALIPEGSTSLPPIRTTTLSAALGVVSRTSLNPVLPDPREGLMEKRKVCGRPGSADLGSIQPKSSLAAGFVKERVIESNEGAALGSSEINLASISI